MTPDQIEGVRVRDLQVFADDRGSFRETYRESWFPEVPQMVQGNLSYSKQRVLRGLHFHHRQADYWFVPQGRILAALADLRVGSPTFKAVTTIELGEGCQQGLYIPPGVAHGYYALTAATMAYLVDQYYDNSDEFGVAWDDPDLGIPWPFDDPPLLSLRDRTNPKLSDIDPKDLVQAS